MSRSTLAASLETTLIQSLNDLQVRAQVEEMVREMVTDVEIANQLEERLEARSLVSHLEGRIAEQESALEESRLIDEKRRMMQATLADKLVKELWELSKELGELQAIKSQHEALLMQHDEVVAKLIQTEEDLDELRRSRVNQVVVEEQGAGEPSTEGVVASTRQNRQLETVLEDATNATDDDLVITKDPDSKKEVLKTDEPNVDEQAVAKSAVALVDDGEPDTPKFEELETPILMQIFAFLDALDILNTAQVNVCMYSRVDSLFGLGQPELEDTSTIDTAETGPSTKPASGSTTAGSKSTTTKVNPSSAVAPTAPRAKVPVASSPMKPVVTPSKPTPASPTSSDGPRGLALFSSILQPRKSAASSAAASPRGGGGGGGGGLSTSQHKRSASADTAQPMNAAMANSMAAKLTDAELNAIILMTERLRQKEAMADRLVKENEELAAKVDGVEAVKDYLIGKIRDIERSLSTSEDNEAKVAQQIASDQEVIAFLDGRVQELEAEARSLEKDRQAAVDELKRVKEQGEQRSSLLADILQFERERLVENERESKATRKVLVKEVKHCRAQIVALQAERDGYREQNELLRKAVMSSPGAGGGGMSRDQFYT